jgi:hypothetical protein
MKTQKIDVIEMPFNINKDWTLVKFADNWADEIDVAGFMVVSTEELEGWKSKIPDEEFSVCIGTNEEIEYSDREQFLKKHTFTPLTQEQAQVYFDHFGKRVTSCEDWDGERFQTYKSFLVCRFGLIRDLEYFEE